MAVACGYEDSDDLDHLRRDTAFKMVYSRLPETGADVMSQPTLSRFENTSSWRDNVGWDICATECPRGAIKMVSEDI